MKYPLKLIEWEDAFNGNHNWVDIETVPKVLEPHIVQTVGFEIRRCKDRVTLAGTVADAGNVCDLFTIPVRMIVREKTLRSRL